MDDHDRRGGAPVGTPGHLKEALVSAGVRPSAVALGRVTVSDQRWLEAEFRRRSRPSQQVALAWCLVYSGSKNASPLITETLRQQVLRPVEDRDYGPMLYLIEALAVCAQDDDTALATLQEMTEFAWWWMPEERASHRVSVRLSDHSLQFARIAVRSLGLTGRREARALLEDMRFKRRVWVGPSNPCYSSEFLGERVVAQCYLDVFDVRGRDALQKHFGDDTFRQWCAEWGKGKTGRELLRWAFPADDAVVWKDVDGYFATLYCDAY